MDILDITQKFCEEMNKTNSTLDKKEVLRKYPEMKEMLEWVYNPFKQFYITSDNLKKKSNIIGSTMSYDIFSILNMLSKRIKTGHEAIGLVNGFIKENKKYEEVIYNIIDKDLKCRIGDKIINDVYPNLIPTFSVSLCNKFQDRKDKITIDDGTWHASHKLDGCVSGDTVVELQNNGKICIKDVVNNRIKDKIKCFDHKLKKVVYENIIEYGKDIDINTIDNTWFKITLENGTILKVTANHLIFLKNDQCYRRADLLKEGDILLLAK